MKIPHSNPSKKVSVALGCQSVWICQAFKFSPWPFRFQELARTKGQRLGTTWLSLVPFSELEIHLSRRDVLLGVLCLSQELLNATKLSAR